MTLQRRVGTVTVSNAGPPPTVTIQVGGDTASTYDAPYLDSYDPTVGDAVQVLSEGGYHVVLGRAATSQRRIWAQTTTSVGTISTVELSLVVPSPTTLTTDGLDDVECTWSWDSYTGTVLGDRLSLRVKAAFNGGGFSTVARTLLRCTGAAAAEGGGSGYIRIPAPAAGSWAYKLVGVLESGTGTFTVNAGTATTSPITFVAERSA